MPCDYSKYPPNWKEIRREILNRAYGKCEWCGVANGTLLHIDGDERIDIGQIVDNELVRGDAMYIDSLAMEGEEITRVVLTIAHLGTDHPDGTPGDKHDKMDCRPENLAALCQKCHLAYDLEDHMRHAAETRRKKRIAAGQVELIPEEMLSGA